MAIYDTDPPDQASIKIRLPFQRKPVASNVTSATAGTSAIAQFTAAAKSLATEQILTGDGLEIDHFLAYEYNQHFLIPADASRFELAGDLLSDGDLQALQPGSRVEVSIDDQLQSVGYIDEVIVRGSRGGGTVVVIEVRDWLSPAVDCHVDPQSRFAATNTLAEIIRTTLGPFGVTVQVDDNIANRNGQTGRIYGVRTSKKGRTSQKTLNHLIKPYLQEGAFQFASRVAQRFGLWIWPTVTYGTVVVGQPEFNQEPRYQLLHKTDPQWSPHNNVLDYEVTFSRKEQPSMILASGWGGGGEFAKSSLRGAIINPYITPQPPNIVDQLLSVYPNLKGTTPSAAAINGALARVPLQDPNARPLYLYDPESHNQAELDAFLRRELSLRMRKVLTAHYTIEGHRINGQPIVVDTIIDVDDDRAQLHQPMYILGRRFAKRAGSGTTTTMELIVPGTLTF